MATSGDFPANHTTNVSNTVTRVISRQARRGVPTVVSAPVSTPAVTLAAGSTDRAGQVLNWDIPGTGSIVTVTYANPYQPPAPIVIVSPASANIAAAGDTEIFVLSRSTTDFQVRKVDVEGAPIVDGSFNYHVIETGFINPPSTKLT